MSARVSVYGPVPMSWVCSHFCAWSLLPCAASAVGLIILGPYGEAR